ncbi:cilia- and flagella-associated protein 99-like [Pectinophora gossypiella]|uniref:cilia- and flagella-associated protein 99-like n=1 Tax=Pectinophora gossypiella TaxID=13191 RepID=UPI00214EDC7A|nr:cilia- and flagella-associated protein 99-like [Pectinophora gossypiella]
MVFYNTSGNIKTLRNIILDHKAAPDMSPYEYMKMYIEKCPENIDDNKLTWIAETFLGIQKHEQFLKDIAIYLSEELSDEDQDYFMIVLYAITFQILPKDMQLLYKSLFNVSKTLLSTFTDFLSNNEVLTYISHVAQTYYDANYITEKIIGPLFTWQPYISEMAHNYAEYVKKVEDRKIKPPTVPIQPNVLNRKTKEVTRVPSQPLPGSPPNSIHNKRRKMVTKSAIDRRLKSIHEKNKQKAANLLNVVKTADFHFAQQKPAEKKLSYNKQEVPELQPLLKPKKVVAKSALPPVRENIATIKRFNKRIQMTEQEEVEWLYSLTSCCRNPTKIDDLIEYDRQEKEKERIYDIEKKHLMGQISYEEAVLAKKKLHEENKKKFEMFRKEKEVWDDKIEKWKATQLEKSRMQIATLSLIESNIVEAKNNIAMKNKEAADKIKKEKATMEAEVMRFKKEELDRKIKMIKEIKVLAMIAKKARVPKIIDLTESSGLGLLGEMSIAELQERLAAMKIGIKEEIERKKTLIKEENETAKKELEDVRDSIKSFISERAEMRKQVKLNKKVITLDGSSSKELNDLKNVLEEKRRLRAKLMD